MARTDPRPHYGLKRRVGVGGYIDLYRPKHHLARRDGYVSEHRFVLYEAGFDLAGLQVHHKNGDRTDNRLANLELVTAAEHTKIHAAEKRSDTCPQGHLFDDANTWRSKEGYRHCRACNRERQRERKRLAKAAKPGGVGPFMPGTAVLLPDDPGAAELLGGAG